MANKIRKLRKNFLESSKILKEDFKRRSSKVLKLTASEKRKIKGVGRRLAKKKPKFKKLGQRVDFRRLV